MALMIFLGAARAVKRYVGSAWRTDLRRTKREAILRGLKVQLRILLEMERRRLSQEMDEVAAPVRGMPR